MNKLLIEKLKPLQLERSDKSPFKNHIEFLKWTDQVLPLLSFDNNLKTSFDICVLSAKAIRNINNFDYNNNVNNAIGILNQAVLALEINTISNEKIKLNGVESIVKDVQEKNIRYNNIFNANSEKEEINKNECGALAKLKCDQKDEINNEFSDKNIFLDIPYSDYEDYEKELLDLLKTLDLNPIIAKNKLTSNAILCKICKLIKTCKYGFTDISSGSNSVSYEYGLMHGFGMKVCLAMRKSSESDKFSDINGLEHLTYNGIKEFKIVIAKWILHNISEINVEKLNKIIEEENNTLENDEGIDQLPTPPKYEILDEEAGY